MVYRIAAVLLCLAACSSRPPALHESDTGTAHWSFSEMQASAEWCARNQTGPRYSAVLAPSGADHDADTLESLFEGPVRISIRAAGVERYAWNGFHYSVWAIDQSLLVYARFNAGLPGASLIAVDLEAPREVLWETPTSHPLPQGWSLWSNQMNVEIRENKVYVRSIDGGRYLDVFDRRTGQSLGWRQFPSRP